MSDAAPIIHLPGALDIVVANQTDGTVSVLIGNGDGTFQTATTVTVDGGPTSVAVGDINGDGFEDLVTADYGVQGAHNGDISVLLGDGAGGFTPASGSPIHLGGTVGPYSTVIADLNGDGFGDIISANYKNSTISVFLGSSGGTFGAPTNLTLAGAHPLGVSVGDFDNDGKLDIATANFNGGISILHGDGNGALALAQTVTLSGDPGNMAVGDINGDGFSDIVAPIFGDANSFAVSVVLNNSTGTAFQAATTITTAAEGPLSVALGDINGDGNLDMVVAGDSNSTIAVELGNGSGGFTAGTTIGPASNGSMQPTFVSLADVNGDGRLDLIATGKSNTTGNGVVIVMDGNGNGTFQAPSTLAVGNKPESLAVADLQSLTVLKNHSLVLSGANAITVSDVDGGTETITLKVSHGTLTLGSTSGLSGLTGNGSATVQFSGTIAQINTAMNGLTYTPTNNYHGADSVRVTIDDNGAALPTSAAQGIFIQNTNTAPTISVTGTTTEAVQGGVAIAALASVTVADSDGDNIQSATVTISNAQTGDILAASTAGTSITASYNSTTHKLTLSGSDTAAHYQQVLAAVTFQDTGTDTSTGSHPTRTISWQVNDGTVDATTPGGTTLVIDRAPTLSADSYSVVETATSTGTSGTAGTGVLGNDSDKDTDAIVVSAVNSGGGNVGNSLAGTYGHLTLNSNGSFSYVADNTSAIDSAAAGSHPVDTFTYTVSDGLGGTTTTTVSFTIDRAPSLTADSPATQAVEGGSAVTGSVLSNDSDKDGDTVVVSAVNGSGGNVGNSIAGTYGHMTIGSNGSYSYSADNTSAIDAAATGSHLTDTFTYTAGDGHGGTATTTITVTLDRAPTVVADTGASQAVESGSAVTGNVLTNDSDRDGDTLVVSAVAGSGGNVGNSIATTYGHITVNANGSYSYSADNTSAIDAAATGSHLTDTVTYTASDGHGGTTTTNLTVTLDRAPTVAADAPASQAVESGSAVTGNVLSNDSDRDGDTLTVSAVAGSGANVGNSIAGTYGHITINANGTYSYSADNTSAIDAAATGSHLTDTFTYTASDGHGGTTTTNIVVTIDRGLTVTADSPVAQALEGGSAITGNVLTNDSDSDGDTLTVSAVAGSGANVGNSVAGTYGHITINANGNYSYSADNTSAIDAAATGSHLTDTFTYTASDGHGGTTTTNIVVTIDRAPTVVADTGASQAVESGAAVTGNMLTNDSDHDGDALILGIGGDDSISVTGTYGHFTISDDGTYSYSADNTGAIDAAATGSHLTDTYNYTADDGHGGTAASTLTITLDRGPTVANDSNSAAQNVTVAMTALTGVLTNDSDRDGDTLAVSAVGGSAGNVGGSFATTYGHITLNADGSYSYIADNAAALAGAANGSRPVDAISFTVSDGHGGTTAETLNITVDRAATATADSLSTNENANAVSGSGGNANLLANDVDKDGDAIAVTAVNGVGGNVGSQITLASGALLTLNANGTYTYNPNHVFDYLDAASHATDSFTYTITGGSTVTVTVTVNGVDSDDTVNGTSGDDHINAGAGDDTIFVTGGGNDTVNGGTGDDTIRFGTSFTAGDSIDGGANNDRVIISGDYSAGVVFGPATMTNVETLQLSSGHAYNLTTNDTTVAAGKVMTVIGTGTTQLTFDGSAETDGSFQIYDGAGNDAVTGGGGKDIFKMGGGGTDTVHGGGGDDLIYMSSTLTAADVIDGGAGKDTLDLDGDYTAANALVFGATTMSNVEIIALEAAHSYDLTLNDANVAAGVVLTVKAGTLGAGDTLNFNGSAETDGRFSIASGAGNDHLIGGANADSLAAGNGTNTIEGGGGKDTLSGGIGPDTFVYATAAASSGAVYDTVVGFDAASDMFDVQGTIGGIDTTIASGKLTTAHINADLTALVGSTQLLANHAVLVKPDTGNLAGHTFLVVDQNGIAGYQTGADLVIDLQSASLTAFGTHNFV